MWFGSVPQAIFIINSKKMSDFPPILHFISKLMSWSLTTLKPNQQINSAIVGLPLPRLHLWPIRFDDKIYMIVEPDFIQQYYQERRLEKQIGESYGYKVSNEPYSLKQALSVARDGIPKINTRLNPLQVKRRLVQPSQRLKELNQEIQQIKTQKKINEMVEREGTDSPNISQMLNQKIREYNYIVEHKHITDVKEDIELQQILRGKTVKPESELIAQQIDISNRQMRKCSGSLQQLAAKSKEISQLYSKFSRKIISRQMANSQEKRSSSVQAFSADKPKLLTSLNTARTVFSRSQAHSPLQNLEPINLKELFLSEKEIKTSRQLEKSAAANQHSVQIWRHRIDQLEQKCLNKSPNEEERAQADKSDILPETQAPSIYSFSSNDLVDAKIKEKMELRQHYISSHLRKKNCRYIREAGNKFVSKFNSTSLAKSMLEGQPLVKKKPDSLPIRKRLAERKPKTPEGISENQRQVLKMMVEEESDMYYWTASRNEKMNLLLKGKKHG